MRYVHTQPAFCPPMWANQVALEWCGYLRRGGASRVFFSYDFVREMHVSRFRRWISRHWDKYATRAALFLQAVDASKSGKSRLATQLAICRSYDPTLEQIQEAWEAAIDKIPLHGVLRDWFEINEELSARETIRYSSVRLSWDKPIRGIQYAHVLR